MESSTFLTPPSTGLSGITFFDNPNETIHLLVHFINSVMHVRSAVAQW